MIHPSEYQECAALAQWLDARRFWWTHVPMGGKRDPKEAGILKRIGAKAGVQDVLIFTGPDRRPLTTVNGIAIEEKRRVGGAVSEAQREWRDALRAANWAAEICRGAARSVEFIEVVLRQESGKCSNINDFYV